MTAEVNREARGGVGPLSFLHEQKNVVFEG